jgi:GNAT superfamily N-acetyltransferase
MKTITVRAADSSDAEAIAGIHTRSWQLAYRGIFPESFLDGLRWEPRRDFWEDQLLSPPPGQHVLVAEHGEVLAGFTAAGPARDDDLPEGSSEVYAIYVDPPAWSIGVGSALFGRILGELASAPVLPQVVALWVLEGNHRARRFYERHSFSADGTAKPVERGGVTAMEIRYCLTVGNEK